MADSRDGACMAGGTLDGRLFLWEVSTGSLLVTVDAHYRAVSVLAFSDDGAALVSGSEDATVSVWSIGRLLNSTPMNPTTPLATLSDHTLPVTDPCVGVGAFPECRLMNASLNWGRPYNDDLTTASTLQLCDLRDVKVPMASPPFTGSLKRRVLRRF
ncbi:hypothetical protein JCM8097_000236 [Rhodosporidiobolus ruineniae]